MKVFDAVTQHLLQLMEAGTSPWHRPWKALRAQGKAQATNLQGRPYRGINALILTSLCFENPVFLTFNQAKALGGNIRKGEHGFPVLFWKLFELTEEKARKPEDVGRKIPMERYYTVFNVSQTEGLDLPGLASAVPAEGFDPIEDAEQIVANMPSRPAIYRGYNRCGYRPLTDEIIMPSVEAFERREEEYSSLFHELVHSTGHSSRLNRREVQAEEFDTQHAYSFEELVAEIGSAFLCAAAGVDNVIENQAAYLRGWHKKLAQDPALLVLAAARAQKAADFILGTTFAENPVPVEAAA